MSIEPAINDIAQRMFVATADQNYVLARLAYFNDLDTDFFWLSLHALEKYMKAILLMNGRATKDLGHDIVTLHGAVTEIHPKLSFGPLVAPKIEHLHWFDRTVVDFLKRLHQHGNPHNRYMVYGFNVMLCDLMMVDQLVWAVRRHCRPLSLTIEGHTFDEVEQLQLHPTRWELGVNLPLEAVVNGKPGAQLREPFLRLNTPFAPNVEHELSRWRSASATSPLADYLMYLRSPNATPDTKDFGAKVLKWAVENIAFDGKYKSEINRLVNDYQASLPRS